MLPWPGPKATYAKSCDTKMAIVWLILVQPLLFGAIGVEIDFHQISGSVVVKTVITLALGGGLSPSRHPCPTPVLMATTMTMMMMMV